MGTFAILLVGAVVVTGLLLPGGGAAELQAGAGWDQVTLVAKLTGREPVTEAEGTVLRDDAPPASPAPHTSLAW